MASELEVGGVSSTTAKLGSSAGSAHGDADDLIVGNGSSTNAGITFNTPSAGGYLYFADGSSGDDFYRGFIKYVHSGNAMEFGTNAVSRLSISSTGRVDTVANNNGDWSFKSQNTHASGFGTLIVAGGSTASQTAFEVRHTGNTGSGTSALKIDGTGLATFSGGINLGDTTLSNYKEGSWTPTATAGSIAGSNISYAGKYTRIGDTVHINLKISATANDLVIGSYVGISGLPFTVNETASGYYSTEDIELHHGGEANAGGTAVYLSAGGSATSTQNIYLSLTYYV